MTGNQEPTHPDNAPAPSKTRYGWFADLRRRNVFRVAAAYAAVAWLLLQVADILFEALRLPPWSLTLFTAFLVLGFPIAVVIAWAFQMTPDGLVLDVRRDRSAVAHEPMPTGRYIDFAIIAVLAIAVGFLSYRQFFAPGSETGPESRKTEAGVSIAVLPFLDLSRDQDAEYFSDGISEELVHALANIEGLRVAARTSSFYFKDQDADIRDIARQLGVSHVLEGSVRKDKDTVRVTAQLIDSEGYHLWSKAYDRELQNIFNIQTELADAIASSLRISLQDPSAELFASSTDNLAAYDLYLRGRTLWHQRTKESLQAAADYFEQAIALDEQYALAYSGLADAYNFLVFFGGLTPAEANAKAEPAIRKALALNPDLAEAHASLGLLLHTNGQLAEAESVLKDAIILNPNYVMSFIWLGFSYVRQDRFAEALQIYLQAHALDPLNPTLNMNIGANLFLLGRYDEGMTYIERTAETNPTLGGLYEIAIHWSGVYGHLDQGVAWARRALQIDPGNADYSTRLAALYNLLGNPNDAQKVIRSVPSVDQDNPNVLWDLFNILLVGGDYAQLADFAETELEKLPADRDEWSTTDEIRITWGLISLLLQGAEDDAVVLAREHELAKTPSGCSIGGKPAYLVYIAYADRQLGETDSANKLIDYCIERMLKLEEQGLRAPTQPFRLAILYALKGQTRQSFAYLEEAVNRGWRGYWLVVNDPLWQDLRNEAGFAELLEQVRRDVDAMALRVAAMSSETVGDN